MDGNWRELLRGVVHPWHHDQFGHMNVRWYAHFFDDASFHLWAELGLNLATLHRDLGVHTVTAKSTTTFVKELVAGDIFRIEGGVGRIGTKSVTFSMRMLHVETGEVHGKCEIVEVFFDPESRTSATIPGEVREKLEGLVVE